MRDQFDKDEIVLENALAFWVNRFYETTRRAMYRAFREHGHELTPEQWMVLVRLWERDGHAERPRRRVPWRCADDEPHRGFHEQGGSGCAGRR